MGGVCNLRLSHHYARNSTAAGFLEALRRPAEDRRLFRHAVRSWSGRCWRIGERVGRLWTAAAAAQVVATADLGWLWRATLPPLAARYAGLVHARHDAMAPITLSRQKYHAPSNTQSHNREIQGWQACLTAAPIGVPRMLASRGQTQSP